MSNNNDDAPFVIPSWENISPTMKQYVLDELDECKWEAATNNPILAIAFASAADFLSRAPSVRINTNTEQKES